MLSRAFRLTDKLSNALLRTAGWALAALALTFHEWRIAWQATFQRLWVTLSHTASRTARTGQTVARTTEERRRATMARRAVAEDVFQIVREDPLRVQNRALSLFTVVLLVLLIGFVWWFTGTAPINGVIPPPGTLPTLQLSATPGVSAGQPTLVPTATTISDPLRVGGSIVYAMHQRGYDNLWVIGIGQSNPIRLTNDATDDRDPAWSHDGTRIAFASHRDGNWELYIMVVATGAIRRLTFTPGYEGHPVWSPDNQFIAYEGYVNNNLDIWIVPADGSAEPQRLTQSAAPDFGPAWSPGGRDIAYVSVRDGSPQIYDLNLDHLGNPPDSTALRLSNVPGIACDSPTWSPDGQEIAFSGRDANGLQLIYVVPLSNLNAKPTVAGTGRDPVWAPNGQSLLSAVDRNNATTFIANAVGAVGVATTTLALEGRAGHPDWTRAALPASLLQHPPPSDPVAPPLYTTPAATTPTPGAYDKLAVVLGDSPDSVLNEQVADSFIKLRQAVINKTGLDLLGSNVALWWAIQGANRHILDPGLPLQNWHYAGRAFDFDRNLVYGNPDTPNVPPPVEVVREDDIDGQTYWRIYIRVPDSLQGTLGEPLKKLPWDFASRSSQDPIAYQNGGRLKSAVPSGYYVDFTDLTADYGWQRVPAGREWRALAPVLLYWEFDRQDGLTWDQAMSQLYPPDQIQAFLSGPTPVPTALNNPTPASAPRTATPIPPDQLH